jgi:hypothetical protein
MRWRPSLDTVFAVVFAVCVVLALLLLSSCAGADGARMLG